MKVTLVARSLELGGAERQLVELALGLVRLGHAVSVLVFYGGGVLEADLRAASIPVIALEKRHRWDVLPFLARLRTVLAHEQADVVHTFQPLTNVLVGLLRPVLPPLRLVWAIRASDLRHVPVDWIDRVSWRLTATLAAAADLIVVNSEAGLEHAAASGVSRARMRFIPNGIDTDRFRPDPEGRARVRAELGLHPDETVIGLVARLDPVKDHHTFLAAAASLAPRRGGLRFVVVGDGAPGYRAKLEARARALGLGDRVVWAGARTDMPAVYAALDAVCLCSLSEGFPNVVAEAMACGRPCVVTAVGDCAALVGPTGEVVPAGAPAALAAGLLALLGRLARDPAAGAAARARIVERYGTHALLERTVTLFESLAARPAARRAS